MKTLHIEPKLLVRKLFKLERSGRYDTALAELQGIWDDTTSFPKVEDFESRLAAELILRCGSLIGFLGHNKQIPNAQEKSKNLLTEARQRFLDIYDIEKIAECENYLALAYWRTGEFVEAETWIEEALSHNLPDASDIRIYAHLTKSLIFLSTERYREIVVNLEQLKVDFRKYGDAFLNGSFCTNLGVALEIIGNIPEALKNLELARYFHQKSRHKIYLGTVENNLALLYKAEQKFGKAHLAIDRATKVFKQIKDRTRQGFSLDTKAQIYSAERKYTEALQTIEAAIKLLGRGENAGYLAEACLTKIKVLISLNDISAATACLCDAVQTAKTQISEKAADNLIKEFENALREKLSSPPVSNITAAEDLDEDDHDDEELHLVLPPPISHYDDIQAVRIKNTNLEDVGLKQGSLAIVAHAEVQRGDLVAVSEIADDSVSCGFYDFDFGIICLENGTGEPHLFDEEKVEILGKIIGVCHAEKNTGGKMLVEPLNVK